MATAHSVAVARPREVEEALHLIFAHHASAEDRSQRVAHAVKLIREGELDRRGISVVRRKTGLAGAMLSALLPGATGLVWPPQALPGRSQRKIEDLLVRHARARLQGQGAKMGQAIIPQAETPLVEPLLRNGFNHMTTLWYLRRETADVQLDASATTTASELPDGVSFVEYAVTPKRVFEETLGRTYVGTLDCPEIDGIRNLNDVIRGHRKQAHSDPRLWWLLTSAGRPAGVLMLTPVPEWTAMDISYLGVIPEYRGQGLGRVLTAQALRAARLAGANQLTLAVDGRNLPAWKIYMEMGFEAHEPREVYLAKWRRL